MDTDEAKGFFEGNFSHVYFILYDCFVSAETNLRQRGKNICCSMYTIFHILTIYIITALHCNVDVTAISVDQII